MNDDQLLRYSRHILLPQCDHAGQVKLLESHALIIGLGGLGSPVAMYLAAAGVGNITLVDDDNVDSSNLQRQIIHTTECIGQSKVASSKQTLLALNPDTIVNTIDHRPQKTELQSLVSDVDVVLDCSDNFNTRFTLNEVCANYQTPLVSGAAIRLEGQVSVFNLTPSSPCYRCLYKDNREIEETCSENGILAPVVGIIGSVQATETLKILANIGTTLDGRVLLLDAANMEWRSVTLRKDPECPICQID